MIKLLNRDIYSKGKEIVLIPKGARVWIIKESHLLQNCTIQYQGKQFYEVAFSWLDDIIDPDEEVVEQTKAEYRKDRPIFSGVLNYFPNALKEVANCSRIGNEQHHPGKPLHWDMSKSKDEADALVRHLIDHHQDPMDDDGVQHLAKVCWRALAMYERFLTDKI